MEKKKNKIIIDYKTLERRIRAHKILGHKIVCTIGSWDMLHIGHLRYLQKAKSRGDILIVGTDSDIGIKKYKNPLRPVIPQDERMEMLSYQECVDYITLIDDVNKLGQWRFGLIKTIPVDVFFAVKGSYPPEQIREIEKHCPEVFVAPRQAKKTSTTQIIQGIVKGHLLEAIEQFKI